MKRVIKTSPIDLELELKDKGFSYVIGIDEAGRGALAGGLYIGYCVLPLEKPESWIMKTFEGVTDSKNLTEKRRNDLKKVIEENAVVFGSVDIHPRIIDDSGLSESNRIGVKFAIDAVIEVLLYTKHVDNPILYPDPYDARIAILGDKGLYVDYHPMSFPYTMKDYVNGELKSLSIAAASIMAKVNRDEAMKKIESDDDIKWEFAKHKGYGTAAHIAAIKEHGVHYLHRKTFAPIPTILKARNEI